MNEHIVIAAQIDWTGGTVYVTDTTLRIDAALLEDGQFEPRILGGVNWGEAARHPYQQQAGELVVGNLTLANADGGLDALASGDVVGAEVELRRGSDADRWADLEFVFVARVSGVRLNGRSEIVLELENVLADLAGPVFSDKFASTVPNPQLEGKDIPLVLGRVKQAPVLEFNPATLTYYTATNASLIGEVAEGGNPTQRWTLEDQPTFQLKGSPTLPITADFEGPADDDWEVIVDDDLNTWVSGSDTSLTSPYTSQGNRPSGWTLVVGALSGDPVVSQDGGLEILITPPVTNAVLGNAGVASNGQSVAVGSSITQWTDPQKAVLSESGSANLVVSGGKTEALQTSVTGFDGANYELRITATVNSGTPILEYYQLRKNNSLIYQEEMNLEITNFVNLINITEVLSEIKPDALGDSCELLIKLRDDSACDIDISNLSISSEQLSAPSVHLRRSLSLISGRPYNVEISYNALGPVSFMVGSSGVLEDYPEPSDYTRFLNEGFAVNVNGSGAIAGLVKPSNSIINISYQPAYRSQGFYNRNTVTITRIKITEQKPANTSYKLLAPYILTTAGIDPALHLDQTAINAHADSFGDPDLGWLVKGDETVDQILFRLAGSLGGYVWHGLDGKVRSKRLALPTDPGGTPFTIDESRADIDEISAFDDPAPQLTTRVNALRNWQPIDPDRQAGITSTWTESDRAAAAADWRITRVYAADANYKRRWAAVESREPYSSALLTGTDAQTLANQAGLWANRPRFYEVPCEVLIGELSQVAVGNVVRVELDYPGLDGVWMLVLGREGDARPGTVNLTLWG